MLVEGMFGIMKEWNEMSKLVWIVRMSKKPGTSPVVQDLETLSICRRQKKQNVPKILFLRCSVF